MKKIICNFKELDFIIISIILFAVISVPILILTYKPDYSIYETSGVDSIKTVKVFANEEEFSVDVPKAIKTNTPFQFLIDISKYKTLKIKALLPALHIVMLKFLQITL